MIIIALITSILAESKANGSNLPLGTMFVLFQSLMQYLTRLFMIQALKWNTNNVDFCISVNYIFKMIGLTMNYADLLYFDCGKGIYLILLLFNQCYLITYFHPLIHGSIYILKKLVMLSCFDKIRPKVKRCLEKAWRSCRRLLICRRLFERISNYLEIQIIYEIDIEKNKEITDRFSKQQSFI